LKIKLLGWFSGVSEVLLFFLMEDEGPKNLIFHKFESCYHGVKLFQERGGE
jgi:hypothetical protein